MRKDQQFVTEMGLRIREARREKGLTIERLAELTDMAPQYLSEVERGRKALGAENLRAVTLVLRKSADFFLHGVGGADPRRASILEQLVALPPADRAYAVRLLESVLAIVKSAGGTEEQAG